MKLSTLINYRNEFKKLNLIPMTKTVEDELKKVLYLANSQTVSIGNFSTQLQTQEQQIYQSIDSFKITMNTLLQELDQLISEVEKPYFVDSYKLYETHMNNETVADIKNRSPQIPESTMNFYRNRIGRYVGWQHPAMILRPGNETYINDMVSSDPLYLVDLSHELLKPAIAQYNELYQQRLRNYVVDERNQNQILYQLPDSQFGVILCYNYFNFRPFEIIRKWLTELLQKLKPGGVLLMTFNNCNRDKAVMLAENKYCCYTPGNLVTQLVQTLGFEIIFQWHDEGPSTWLELKKPGTLETLRGGQTLAKIMPKPIAESK
jgi:SAM-dependent methyltransferase